LATLKPTETNGGGLMAEKHAVLTGPIKGKVRLSDGREVDVTDPIVFADSHDDALEIAHAVSMSYVETGHPDDVEIDAESGRRVQRPFAYDDSHYQAHVAKKKG
jgi:hypothetical protein